jgi:serine/threonine protein kinase
MEKIQKANIKRIKLSDYEILTTLGTGKRHQNLGSFGRVKLAKQKATGKYFALKMMKKAEIVKSKQIDHVLNYTK